MSFTTLALTGTVKNADTAPIVGAIIQLVLSVPITDGVTEIAPVILSQVTNGSGAFAFTGITANDDTRTIPTGSMYSVTIFNGGDIIDYFRVTVPHASAPSVDLFSLPRTR